jgi:endoglucanase
MTVEWSLDAELARRPRVRVNQLGYLPDGPKRAVLVTDATASVRFEVRDGAGGTAHVGDSTPWPVRPDPSSGMHVHQIDFRAVTATGEGFRIVTDEVASHPFTIRADLYGPLAVNALRFFTLQRSGITIDDAVAPGYARPAGHVGVAPNRGDTAVRAWTGPDAERLYPGWRCAGEFDVSGGWYDAGDHGKYVVNAGLSVAQLLSAHEHALRCGPRQPSASIEDALLAECRWELDWMVRMQVPSGTPLAGMAFHRVHGTEWPAVPMWPHEDPTERVLHRPSTAATLNLAAAAAHGARVFATVDATYAARLLDVARVAYRAALEHPMLVAPDDNGAFGGGPYNDDELDDEFYWAAVEMFLSTGEHAFLDDVERSPCHHTDVFDPDGFDWDRVAGNARLDLATIDSRLTDRTRVQQSVISGADRIIEIQRTQPWAQPYAPDGGWDWGSNGRILNNLVVLATAYDLTAQREYVDATLAGVDFLFGLNALGQSYITGYGTDHTCHQRTRHFAHDLDPTFPPPPPGAIAGGPNSKNYPGFPSDGRLQGLPPQLCYLDEPTSETTNDVCIRWNAPLVWVAMFLAHHPGEPSTRPAATRSVSASSRSAGSR